MTIDPVFYAERCWARDDAGEHEAEKVFHTSWLRKWPKKVEIQCKHCNIVMVEAKEFGTWLEAARAAAVLGAECWLLGTAYEQYCDCEDCRRKHRRSFSSAPYDGPAFRSVWKEVKPKHADTNPML